MSEAPLSRVTTHTTRNKTSTFLIGIITLIAIVVFGYTLVHALWYAPDTEVAAPPPGEEITVALPEEYPARLQIPDLDIDAAVQHVGVNAKGNMANPSNFTDVGWYKYGTVPGKRGSAAMAGHVDNALSLDGVFKHLDELQVGDDIYVETKGGDKLHFIVRESTVYSYMQVPLEKLFNRNTSAWLNLITCEGKWLKAEKTYDQRRIIYAELVS
jgi:LPXTG-site transpeptidase (sortase) family protein